MTKECYYCGAPLDICQCVKCKCKHCKIVFMGSKENQQKECCAFCWNKRELNENK